MTGRWQTLVITVAVALVFDSHAAYSADADTSVPTTIIPDNIIVDNLDLLRFNWTLASNDTKVKATQPPIKYAVYNMVLQHKKNDRARQSFINDFQQRKQCKSVFTVQQSVADSLGRFVRVQSDKVFNTWAMIDRPHFESNAAVYLIKINGTNDQGVTASSDVYVVDIIDSLVPLPVSQLAVVAANASEIRVRWRHTLARHNIVFYTTVTCIDDSQHCAAIPASSRHQELTLTSTDYVLENGLVNVIIGNLNPFTRYQIEVRCRLLGTRCDSHLSSVNTTHFMTSSAPSSALPELHSAGFALSQDPQTGLIVYWKAVPKWYLMDNLMHYRVCVTSSQGPVQCDVTPPTMTSTVLPHVNTTLGPVRVTVDAVTLAGVQPGLNQTRSYIDVSPTSSQLSHVMVVSIVNDTAVDVMWARETSSPPPIYTVFWCRRLHHSGLCQSDISWLDVPSYTTGPVTVSLGGEYKHFSVGMSVSLQHTHTGILWARCFHDVNNNYELQQPSVSYQTTHFSVLLVINSSLCHQLAAGSVTGIEREYVVTHCVGHHSDGCPAGAVLATVTKSMTLPNVRVEVGGLEADEKYSVFVRGVSAHSHSPSVYIPIHTGNTPLSHHPAFILFLVLWLVIVPMATVVGVSILCYRKFTRQLDIKEPPTSNSPSYSGSSSEPLLDDIQQAPVFVRVDSDSPAPRHHSSQQDLKVAADLVSYDRPKQINSYSLTRVLASDDEDEDKDDESIDSRASLAPSDEKCKESTVVKITECTVAESPQPACTVDVDVDLECVGVCAPFQRSIIDEKDDHEEDSQFSDDSGSLLVHKLPTGKVSAVSCCSDAIVMPAFGQVDAPISGCNGIGTINLSGHSLDPYSQLDLSNVLTSMCNSGSSADGSNDIDGVIVDDKTTGDFSEKGKANDVTVDDKTNNDIVAHKTSDISVTNSAANDVNVLDKPACNVVVEDQANDVIFEESDENDSVGDLIYCRGTVTGPNLV